MTTEIHKAMDNLPSTSVTVYALQALDFVVPGVWQNTTGFDNMIGQVAGETNPARVRQISQRAAQIYSDPNNRYDNALQIYTLVDRADAALGAAAMANKMGERISLLSFLSKFTPKADTTQAIDLGVKVTAELVAFSMMKGIPTDQASIGQFAVALGSHYSGEALMRMVALVSFDGIVPLGPDFTRKVGAILGGINSGDLQDNAAFKQVRQWIPGDSLTGQLGFINDSFGAVQGWMDNLMRSRNLTPQKITGGLKQVMDFTDDKLDYVAAFLDMSTTYFAHTGTQSVAHNLIEEAAG